MAKIAKRLVLEALDAEHGFGNRMYLRYVKKTKQFRLQIVKVQPKWVWGGGWDKKQLQESAVTSFELTKANLEQLMDGLILAKALLDGDTKLEGQE